MLNFFLNPFYYYSKKEYSFQNPRIPNPCRIISRQIKIFIKKTKKSYFASEIRSASILLVNNNKKQKPNRILNHQHDRHYPFKLEIQLINDILFLENFTNNYIQYFKVLNLVFLNHYDYELF